MELLDSVMELLSNTSSPSVTVNSTLSSDSIYQMPMDPNHLTQQAVTTEMETLTAPGDVNASVGAIDGGGDGAEAELQPNDQDFSTLLPRLELKLPILSSSSSESESEETAANPTAGTSAETPSDRVASPPPNCAICLGRCKNKCFTDSCMHQFCFKCLCEWSKVKPECPLCKQTFKSIIHNVKSIDQFEEYHVQPPIVQIAHNQFDFPQMRMIVHQDRLRNDAWNERGRLHRFVFNANNPMGLTLSSFFSNGNNGEVLEMYRQQHPGTISSNDTLSQLWRRFIYDRKLYALPVCDVNGRFRDSSAQFYRDNPAQIHRLAPWINRDIVCLLRQTQHDVTAVIESIHASLTIMNILSPAFRRRLTPYLGNKTSHFVHELNNFARAPHDMYGYDGVVQYSRQSNEDLIIEFTSSDDSTDNEIDVADDATVAMPGASTNAINLTIHNRLASNTGRGGDITGTTGGATTRQLLQDDVNLVIDLRGETEEQSAAAAVNSNGNDDEINQSTAQVAENIELTSGSSDECEFVLERKPPHLRTPEMVSLDSASDSDVVFVDESKHLSKATFSTSEGEEDDTAAAGRSKRPTTRSKITALVEAKKRNQQSASAVKNESQGSSELYNVGASTSAALRSWIQRRGDGPRSRRSVYCLRNKRSDPDPSQPPRRRGKRLGSESSHSSSSMGSASSMASSSSTSDEEFVASVAQKQNVNSRKRRSMLKSKNSKCNNALKRSPAKRKKPNDDESSGDEDDNGHMGKNFALVMAIGERLKRQKAKLRKYRPAGASDDEEDSEGENTWRMEAVHEPLRRQQQENLKTKSTLKTTERKRKVRKSTHKIKNDGQSCSADPSGTAEARKDEVSAYNNYESSSDESDNLKLIELKSKLITKCSNENTEGPTSSNRLQEDLERNTADSQSQIASASCPDTSLQTPASPASSSRTEHTQFFKMEEEDVQSSTDNEQHENVGLEDDDDIDEAGDEEAVLHDSDELGHDSSHGEQIDDFIEQTEDDHDHSVNDYSNETTNIPSPMDQADIDEDHDEQHDDDESQTPLNIRTPLNLSHESHVFDGTSMSTTTTTTDTILNDAAEQISSAAVNFYNPQPTFNTADFADDNTSNSSSLESSVSTTTSTSSSNSSSSNTNGFVNYDIS